QRVERDGDAIGGEADGEHHQKRTGDGDEGGCVGIAERAAHGAGEGGGDGNENAAEQGQRDIERRLWAHDLALALRAVTLSPAMPQLSVSTSSMVTTVVAGFLLRTRCSSSVAPRISSALCAAVAGGPVRVILMLT